MNAPRCVIWDWNGTLLDDTAAALAAFNALLVKRALKPIDLAFYRDRFAFPVRPFYAICGIDLDHEDWDALAREYHEAYAAFPKTLNAEAIAALTAVERAGVRQCVLSALRQDLLDDALSAFGVSRFFDRVYGVDNLDGASKLVRARELLAHLTADGTLSSPSDAVLIGDALHDREVADALGARIVLCAVGGHSAERLQAVAPTADTLLGAVRLALTL